MMKKVLGGGLLISALLASGFVAMEPRFVSAVTDEVVVNQTVTSGITISSPADISMSQALTTSANTAVGSAAWTVTTNNQSGYTLSVSAASTGGCADRASDGTADALCDVGTGEAFQDMSTTTKATWSVSSNYKFGYSARGDHTTGHGTDADCIDSTHVPSPTLLYQGFNGANNIQIASSTAETGTSGTATTLCVAVEQNGIFAPSGSYQATTTATAVVQ